MKSIVLHRLYLSARFVAALIAVVVGVGLGAAHIHDYVVQKIDRRCFESEWNLAIGNDGDGTRLLDEEDGTRPLDDGLTEEDGVEGLDRSQTLLMADRCRVKVIDKVFDAGAKIMYDPIAYSNRIWLPEGQLDEFGILMVAITPLVVLVGLRRWVVWLTRPTEDSSTPQSDPHPYAGGPLRAPLDGDSIASTFQGASLPLLSHRPKSVTNATVLLYVMLGMGVLRALMEFPRLAAGASAAFVITVQVAVFVWTWVLIFLIGRRRNWARIVYLVLFVLGTPLSVMPLIDSLAAEPISGWLGLAQAALQIVAIVMLFRGDARGWFRRASHPGHPLAPDPTP